MSSNKTLELTQRYETWRASLQSFGEVTKLNAYEIIGSGPESLLDLAGGWLEDEPPDELENGNVGPECFYPATSIASEYSPELALYREHYLGSLLSAGYDGYSCPPSNSTLYRAVMAQDAAWVTRLQCTFLPVAALAHIDEEYIFATWHPTSKGTSRTYAVHQDDPLYWYPTQSIAAHLAVSILGPSDSDVSDEEREKINTAVRTQGELATEEFPHHLDPELLEPRTRWIVDVFLGRDFDPEFEHLPTLKTWEEEKELVPKWPHLQAYWYLHHLLFQNPEGAAWIREQMDMEHPAIAELEQIAKTYDNGNIPGFFPQTRIVSLRRSAVKREIDALGAEATARIQAELELAGQQKKFMQAFLDRMTASDDAGVVHLVNTWRMLQSAAGDLAGFERELANVIYGEQPEIASTFTSRHFSGETSIFLEVFQDFCELVTPEWEPFFEAAYSQAAGLSEDGEDSAPGSLVGWGIALGSFATLTEKLDDLPWNAGRRRYAELSVVANHFFDEEKAQEHLVTEATDFVGEFGGWEHGTMSYALFALLNHGHPKGAELLHKAFETGNFSGANWQCALALVDVCAKQKNALLAPALKEAVDFGLGRHDDADRARVLRAYAACASDEAKDVLVEMQANIDDVRKECEEAAIVAARLDLEPKSPELQERAVELLKHLIEKGDAMEMGAAYSLLRSAHDNQVSGFAMLAKRASENESDYFKPHMKAWLAENAALFV